MNPPVVEVAERITGIKAKHMRSAGRIPAVCYGQGKPTQALEMDYRAFRKVFVKAGGSTVIDLSMGGKKFPVLVHQVQYDPVSDDIAHVDFIHVDMAKKVTTLVKVVIVGEAPVVKNLGGILDIQKHEIKIKCLPKDLIHSIDVDVSPIVDFKTSVRVRDLSVPSTIEILDNADSTVVTATPPRAEEETKPAVATEGEATAGEAAAGEAKEGEAAAGEAKEGGAVSAGGAKKGEAAKKGGEKAKSQS